MDQFISDNYTILNGTLLACYEQGEHMVIPSEVSGHAIRRIGSGFSVGKTIKTLTIEEGIREIGSNAFPNSEKLRSVRFPASLELCEGELFNSYLWNEDICIYLLRRFTKSEYEYLLQNTVTLVNGSHLLGPGHEDMKQFKDIYSGFSAVHPPALIDVRMHGLYQNRSKSKLPDQYPFEKRRDVVRVSSVYNAETFRKDLIAFMFREKQEIMNDSESETLHDSQLQSSVPKPKANIILSYFYDREVMQRGEDVLVNVHMHFGSVFFPAVINVTYSGKPYFMYRESYLTSDVKHPFFRKDYLDAVYDGKGQPVDKYLAKQIVDKYMLVSMLI